MSNELSTLTYVTSYQTLQSIITDGDIMAVQYMFYSWGTLWKQIYIYLWGTLWEQIYINLWGTL